VTFINIEKRKERERMPVKREEKREVGENAIKTKCTRRQRAKRERERAKILKGDSVAFRLPIFGDLRPVIILSFLRGDYRKRVTGSVSLPL